MPIFDPNIPLPTDDLSDSQQDLLDNNRALDATFARNHRAFSDKTASNGKHTFIEMVRQAAIPKPKPELSSSTGTIYTKYVGASNRTNLFYTNDNSGIEYQLSNTAPTTDIYNKCGEITSDSANFFSGWTFMGQKTIMQYGYVLNAAFSGNVATVTFPFNFDVEPFSIQLTPYQNNSVADWIITQVRSPSLSGFTIRAQVNGNTNQLKQVSWVAIGKYTPP